MAAACANRASGAALCCPWGAFSPPNTNEATFLRVTRIVFPKEVREIPKMPMRCAGFLLWSVGSEEVPQDDAPLPGTPAAPAA